MNNLLSKITTWFQPKKRTAFKLKKLQLAEEFAVKKTLKIPANIPPFNSQHYRQLIGKLAKIAIATQRERQRRKHE